MAEINIKEHPELRHVLVHLKYAIDSLIKGDPQTAAYELESIEGLIVWDNDSQMEEYIANRAHRVEQAHPELVLGSISRAQRAIIMKIIAHEEEQRGDASDLWALLDDTEKATLNAMIHQDYHDAEARGDLDE